MFPRRPTPPQMSNWNGKKSSWCSAASLEFWDPRMYYRRQKWLCQELVCLFILNLTEKEKKKSHGPIPRVSQGSCAAWQTIQRGFGRLKTIFAYLHLDACNAFNKVLEQPAIKSGKFILPVFLLFFQWIQYFQITFQNSDRTYKGFPRATSRSRGVFTRC